MKFKLDKKIYFVVAYFLSFSLFVSCNTSNNSSFQSSQPSIVSTTINPTGEKVLPSPQKIEFYQRTGDRNIQLVFFWLITGVFFTGLARFLFPWRFSATMQSVFKARNFSMLEKETGLMDQWIYFFLYFNYLNVMAVFLYKTFFDTGLTNMSPSKHTLVVLFYFWAALALFIIIKYWIMKLVAWIFNTSEETRIYFRNIIITNQFTGILILPFVTVYIVNPLNTILWIIWGIILLISVYKVLRGATMGLYHSRFSLYYLILYLCAFEIIPLVLAVKFLKIYFQI
ncbi:MAG: DUF4271 domain-containing protein [Bacteroidota bacterium]